MKQARLAQKQFFAFFSISHQVDLPGYVIGRQNVRPKIARVNQIC